MRHVKPVSRAVPTQAFYYNISLTQKLTEIATLASFADAVLGTVKGLFDGGS